MLDSERQAKINRMDKAYDSMEKEIGDIAIARFDMEREIFKLAESCANHNMDKADELIRKADILKMHYTALWLDVRKAIFSLRLYCKLKKLNADEHILNSVLDDNDFKFALKHHALGFKVYDERVNVDSPDVVQKIVECFFNSIENAKFHAPFLIKKVNENDTKKMLQARKYFAHYGDDETPLLYQYNVFDFIFYSGFVLTDKNFFINKSEYNCQNVVISLDSIADICVISECKKTKARNRYCDCDKFSSRLPPLIGCYPDYYSDCSWYISVIFYDEKDNQFKEYVFDKFHMGDYESIMRSDSSLAEISSFECLLEGISLMLNYKQYRELSSDTKLYL